MRQPESAATVERPARPARGRARPGRGPARPARPGASLLLVGLLLLAATVPAARGAVEGLSMSATVALDGHARQGSWMAIDIELQNDGPPIAGELRLTGGTQGRTSFATIVDLPTQSDKVYRMYVQPPGFGRTLEISLVEGSTTLERVEVQYIGHDQRQLIVGIIAERPGEIVGGLDLLPDAQGLAPLVLPLEPADLPRRVEGWSTLDRLIWQDVDASRLDPEQLAALRGWIAGGGGLIIAGGTAGPDILTAFPDAVLPYRPVTTVDVAPSSLRGLLGELPDGATDLPALSGTIIEGRALATSGDRVVAAERSYGSGAVALLGFDPTVDWIDETALSEGLWHRLLPPRSNAGAIISDDSQLVSAVQQLPELALPPIGALAILLGIYIALVGPINYLVLRRLDRRDWAWVTIPVLIALFAAGSYGAGGVLRGSEVIVNEIAIVRGSPGATEGTAQIILGVFSPSRGTYQVRVPNGALLSSPTSGDSFGDGRTSLDVVQGETSAIRDLTVGFGSLRTVRAESAVTVPRMETDLRIDAGRLRGTITNASDTPFLSPAIVLGSTVATLDDLAPGASATVDVVLAPFQFGLQLADKVVGPIFFPDGTEGVTDDAARSYARYAIINQLTYDPNWGSTGRLPVDGAVLLGWSDAALLDLEVDGHEVRRTGNVLYFLPTSLDIAGVTTFGADLMRSTVLSADAGFFSKDPFIMNFGRGSVELAYRPIPFEGTLDVTGLDITLGFGGDTVVGGDGEPVEPLDEVPEPCPDPPTEDCPLEEFDGMPEVELFDQTTSTWQRFPHMPPGIRHSIVDPARYVDATGGTVRVRLVNDRSDSVSFTMDVRITGQVR